MLRRILVMFFCILGLFTTAKNVWADCSIPRRGTDGVENSSDIIKSPEGGQFCNKITDWWWGTRDAVGTCVNGKVSYKDCGGSSGDSNTGIGIECVQSGNTAECRDKNFKKCILEDGNVRDGGEHGCDGNAIAICDGATGSLINSVPCATGEVCQPYIPGPLGSNRDKASAHCVKSQCTDSGITANEGDKICFKDQKKIKQCLKGTFVTYEDCNKHGTTCTQDATTGNARCNESGMAECNTLNGVTRDVTTQIGAQTCDNSSNPQTILKCTSISVPSYEVVSCKPDTEECRLKNGEGVCVLKTESPSADEVIPKSSPLPIIYSKNSFCDGHDGKNGHDYRINTALGCIPVGTMGDFVKWLLPPLFGIIGGISFLMMVYGFILIAMSSGDPKKVQGARETITSAITGLLVSIFAIFLLRLIAVNILHIPGIN